MYRIFRMREQTRLSFRAAPHTSGETAVKLKDYVEAESIEALNTYEAWEMMRAAEKPLEVGDILESELGGIEICKYIGFDPAKWIVPEVKPGMEAAPAGAGKPAADSPEGKI
jgi:hypothetical protein